MATYAPTAATLAGRWADTGNGYTVLAGGSSLRYRFTGTGTSLTVVVPTRGYSTILEYRVDGGTWARAAVSTTFTVASGLTSGNHTAEVRLAGSDIYDNRWTNRYGLTVAGITADTVSAWPYTGKRILVVGDSIAEGRLALGSAGGAYPDVPIYATGRLGFAQLLADAHDAELHPFCFGGAGLINTTFSIPPLHTAYPYAMSGITATDPAFDVVLVEAGANDGTADSATFRANYGTLLDLIKAAQPQAAIYCMEPITQFDSGDSRGADIEYVAGIKGAHFISTDAWTISAPYLNHPDATGHAQMAAYLEPILGDLLEPAPTYAFADLRALLAVPTSPTYAYADLLALLPQTTSYAFADVLAVGNGIVTPDDWETVAVPSASWEAESTPDTTWTER